VTLTIDSIVPVNPVPCKHFEIQLTTPAGAETVSISDDQLTELLETIREAVPESISVHAIVAVIWAAWRNKVRGATVPQIINKDIDI